MKMRPLGTLRLVRLVVRLHSPNRLLRRINDRIHTRPWVVNTRYHHPHTSLFSTIPPTRTLPTRQNSFAKAATALVRAPCRPLSHEKWFTTIHHRCTVARKSLLVRTWLQPLLPRVFICAVPPIIPSSQIIHLTAWIQRLIPHSSAILLPSLRRPFKRVRLNISVTSDNPMAARLFHRLRTVKCHHHNIINR